MKLLPLASVLTITSSVTLCRGQSYYRGIAEDGLADCRVSQAFDNRSTFILFRNPAQSYLVQCRVGYDVTRTPSTYTLCYKLR